jgi:50S ribosomal subunit-associated GTPase HflX
MLTVYNKIDLINPEDALPAVQSNELCVSAVTGQGLPELVAEIEREVGETALATNFMSRRPKG